MACRAWRVDLRCVHRYLRVVVMSSAALAVAQPAQTPLPTLFGPASVVRDTNTPSQPILVVQDSASADPYQNFVPELLTTEGLNGFETAQLPS